MERQNKTCLVNVISSLSSLNEADNDVKMMMFFKGSLMSLAKVVNSRFWLNKVYLTL